jgi:hypothetical protein
MAVARIFRPSRTVMQSGQGRTRKWVLRFEPTARKEPDPLMGWLGSNDTRDQIRLTFETREQAIAYAESKGLDYEVEEPRPRRVRPRSYADNFRT